MKIPCSFQLHLSSISLPKCPKGQIRISLERGEKSTCTKIYKCSSEIIIDEILNIKTTLQQHSSDSYQQKTIYLRFFFRDNEKQLIKHKAELNIAKFINKNDQEHQLRINLPQITGTLKYITKVVLEKPGRVSIQLGTHFPKYQTAILEGNNFFTNGTILSEISNNSQAKQTQMITTLKEKVKSLETEISILKEQVRLEQKMNTSRFCTPQQNQPCYNSECYLEKQKLLTTISNLKSPTTAEIDKLRAVQISQEETIMELRKELESALNYQHLNKKLQMELVSLENKFGSLEKELKQSKRLAFLKIEELQVKGDQLESVEHDLVKSKMLTMSLWNAIQEKGGSALFDQISSDILQ